MADKKDWFCSSCLHSILVDSHYIPCSVCRKDYHISCAKLTIYRFLCSMTAEEVAAWICEFCCLMKPIQQGSSNWKFGSQTTSYCSADSNINTKKRKSKNTANKIIQNGEKDCKIDNVSEVSLPPKEPANETVMQRFEQLLDLKLENNRRAIVSEIKDLIGSTIKELTGSETKEFIGSEIKEQPESESKEITKPEVKELTVPELEELTDPELKKLSVSELKKLTEPELKEFTVPELKEPTKPELKEFTVPELKEFTVPELKELTMPALIELTVPELKELTMPELTELTVPELKELTMPELKELTVPELKELIIPELKELTVPELKELTLPEFKELIMPELKELIKSETKELTKAENKELTKLEIKELIKSEIKDLTGLEIKELIRSEISKAMQEIKNEVNQNIEKLNNITINHDKAKLEIENLKRNILKLESECTKMKDELQEMKLSEQIRKTMNTENDKTVVLYGLSEQYYESESDLQSKIIKIFQDYADIDLTGYIEDIYRIGKLRNRRPLVIELLSKRMGRYILDNNKFFKNTGMTVSKFLDKETF